MEKEEGLNVPLMYSLVRTLRKVGPLGEFDPSRYTGRSWDHTVALLAGRSADHSQFLCGTPCCLAGMTLRVEQVRIRDLVRSVSLKGEKGGWRSARAKDLFVGYVFDQAYQRLGVPWLGRLLFLNTWPRSWSVYFEWDAVNLPYAESARFVPTWEQAVDVLSGLADGSVTEDMLVMPAWSRMVS